MSQRRLKTREDEQREWLRRRDKERAEAAQRAAEQKSTVPGYRRLSLEEE